MALHIVTSKCFLTCEKVTFVKIEEYPSDIDTPVKVPHKKKRGRLSKKKVEPKVEPKIDYKIMIGYYPIIPANNVYNSTREPNECTLELSLTDKQKANAVYAEIVKEVQEQHPNEGYLDILVSKMLLSDEFKIEVSKEEDI